MSNTDPKIKAVLDKALADAKTHIPSEEITLTEMMENLAHAGRVASGAEDLTEIELAADVIQKHFSNRWGQEAPLSRAEALLVAEEILAAGKKPPRPNR
jgi:hypothetical protein